MSHLFSVPSLILSVRAEVADTVLRLAHGHYVDTISYPENRPLNIALKATLKDPKNRLPVLRVIVGSQYNLSSTNKMPTAIYLSLMDIKHLHRPYGEGLQYLSVEFRAMIAYAEEMAKVGLIPSDSTLERDYAKS